MDCARELAIGELVDINGQRMRYIGNGRFEPEHQWPMAKRFDQSESEPLHRPMPDARAL